MDWSQFLKSTSLNQEIIENEILDRNIQFTAVASILAVFINLFHILLFYLNLDSILNKEHFWRMGVIYAHSFSMVYFLLFSLVFNYHKHIKKIHKNILKFLLVLTYIILNLLGVTLAVLDQIVTSSISPFMFVSVCLPFLILVHPKISSVILFSSYLLFYVTLPLTQPDIHILLSNRVNAFSFVGVGIFFSLFMWNNVMGRYTQDRIIKKQKEDLENSYKLSLEVSENLKIANATKDKFFSIIAHDLRGTFSSIYSFSEMTEEEISNFTKETTLEYISLIKTSAKNTFLLLENLLDWANSQTGSIKYSPTKFNLNEVIASSVNLLMASAKKKNISLASLNKEPFSVFLDKKMIETILRNLLSNAIKFTPEGGRVEIDSKDLGNKFILCISDTGVGLSPSAINSLFKIDKSLSSLGTSGELGSGLGLILVKEFVDKNKGKIQIESEVGKGTKIILEFPNVTY
jgi:two-component system sensor histidine kinase/response regulator